MVEENKPQPLFRRLMDNPWWLLFLGVVIPFVSYTLWGWFEITQAKPDALP